MAGIVVYLYGGKCNGTDKTLTQAEFDSGKTTCKGQTYKHDKTDFPNFELPVFRWVGSPPPNAPPPKTLKAPQAQRGWKDMQRSVNRKMPNALHQSQRLRKTALRQLSRARKVRH